MCNPKVKLLNKEIKKPVLTPTEKISVNMAFKNPNVKISVLPIVTKKDQSEKAVNPESETIKR